MPLLNLGYALGGLSQGYNTAQQQAMQRAVQQLALQQAQSQQNAQRLAAQALGAGLLGKGGGLGGLGSGFNPANIQPVSTPAPGIPAMPSQAPAPPALQQPPMSASPRLDSAADYRPMTPQQWTEADPDTQVRDAVLSDEGVTATSEDKPPGQSGTTTPDTKPAPGPASSTAPATSTTPPAATTSAASGGTGGGGLALELPGGQTIPLSQFFGTIDYGHLAQGIAKLAPPGTDQADIYQAVVDLSKLAEGNKTQQQQAGLLVRAMLGDQFKLVNTQMQQAGALERTQLQQAGATGRTQMQQAGAGERTRENIASRESIADKNRASREAAQAASRELRSTAQADLNAYRQNQLNNQTERLKQSADALGLRYQSAQLSAIRARISTFKPGANGAFDANQQKQLAALNAQAAAIGEQIAAQAAQPAPAQQ